MSTFGKIVEGITFGMVTVVDEAAVPEEGAEVEVERETADESKPRQAAPPRPVSPAATRPAGDVEVASAAKVRSDRDLDTVLDATPEKFRKFLEKKSEYEELLREGDTPEAKIQSVATAKAVKATKLAIADVSEATQVATAELGAIRSEFDSYIRGEEAETVEAPKSALREQEDEISRIESQIERLQAELREKRAGLEPAKRDIAAAEAKIATARAVFDASCSIVERTLKAMESAVIAGMQTKK